MPRVKKNYENNHLHKLVRHVGTMLKFTREQASLSQNKLSKISKVSISTINEIENFKANDIRLSTISTLAHYLNVNPLCLLVPSKFELGVDDKIKFKKAVKVLDEINRQIN